MRTNRIRWTSPAALGVYVALLVAVVYAPQLWALCGYAELDCTTTSRKVKVSQSPDHVVDLNGSLCTITGSGTSTCTSTAAGGMTDTGTTNYLPKWTGANSLGNSTISDNGTSVSIGLRASILNASPTTTPSLSLGSLYLQPYSLNNVFLVDNTYFDGVSFKYSQAGAAGMFYFLGSEGQFRFAPAGSAGATLPNTYGYTQFKVNADGTVAMGSNSCHGSAGNYAGCVLKVGSGNTVSVGGTLSATGPVVASNPVTIAGGFFGPATGTGTQTSTTTSLLSTSTLALNVTGGNTSTLHAIAPVAFAVGESYNVTDTVYATATASGSKTSSFVMPGTRTNTFSSNVVYSLPATGTYTTTVTATGTATVFGTGVAYHTETAAAGVRTYTYAGTQTETVTVTATASVTEQGGGTGTVSATKTSTVAGVGGTATFSEIVTLTTTTTGTCWAYPKTFTGSGTFTGSLYMADAFYEAGTKTSTTIKTDAGTETLTHTATATGTGSWTYSMTHIDSTNTALVSDNPTVVMNGTVTTTVLGTHTHTSADIYGTFTVTQVSGAVADTDTRLTNGRDSTNHMHISGGYMDVGTETRVWAYISENATAVVTNAVTGVVVLPNSTKTLTGTATITETDLATATPTANKSPIANSSGKLDIGWLPIVTHAVTQTGTISSTATKVSIGAVVGPGVAGTYRVSYEATGNVGGSANSCSFGVETDCTYNPPLHYTSAAGGAAYYFTVSGSHLHTLSSATTCTYTLYMRTVSNGLYCLVDNAGSGDLWLERVAQ